MLRRWLDRLEFTKGLGFRLGGLLSVAILPIGLISVIQTLHLSREYERSSEIALLGRTATAAAGERALLQGALGTADALGPAVLETMNNPKACSDIMRGFVQRTVNFVYAGFTRLDGVTECSSVPGVHDLSQNAAFKQFSESPGTPGRTAQMLRVRLAQSETVVPEISANKYALNVRFMLPETIARPRLAERDVAFELTFCSL